MEKRLKGSPFYGRDSDRVHCRSVLYSYLLGWNIWRNDNICRTRRLISARKLRAQGPKGTCKIFGVRIDFDLYADSFSSVG